MAIDIKGLFPTKEHKKGYLIDKVNIPIPEVKGQAIKVSILNQVLGETLMTLKITLHSKNFTRKSNKEKAYKPKL